jgi:fluoride exporter
MSLRQINVLEFSNTVLLFSSTIIQVMHTMTRICRTQDAACGKNYSLESWRFMKHPLTVALLVGCGGFCGSLSRYGLSVLSQRAYVDWPIGTLGANMIGCFLVGVISGLSDRGDVITPAMRLALATGFCGGFTTMSSFMYEFAEMLRASEYVHAAYYAAGTLTLSFGAFFAGVMSVRVLMKTVGGL